MLFDITRLMDFAPTILPRSILHDNPISSLMTHRLASLNYICLFDVWDHKFDKLKRPLTCALLLWWMYSFWLQLFNLYCITFIESWASLFDKLLRALTSFDLSGNVAFDMEWLILHEPLSKYISKGYSLGVLLHLTRYKRFPLSSLFNFVFFCIYLWMSFIFVFFLSLESCPFCF